MNALVSISDYGLSDGQDKQIAPPPEIEDPEDNLDDCMFEAIASGRK
jgi:hypothetical protein